jgi:hypothetical protein
MLALAANHVVHVSRIQRSVRVDGRKITTPDNWHIRAELANLAAALHGRRHLRAGHDGDAQEFDPMAVDEVQNFRRGIVINVAVDDLVLLDAFQDSRQRQHSERQAPISRPGRARIEEHNHGFTSAT